MNYIQGVLLPYNMTLVVEKPNRKKQKNAKQFPRDGRLLHDIRQGPGIRPNGLRISSFD